MPYAIMQAEAALVEELKETIAMDRQRRLQQKQQKRLQ
jgi:hypothetical protein